jgi:hypothetical protein
MTLDADEFMRRFLLHVLPARFHRIRHYGLLSNRNCKSSIPRARRLLQQPSQLAIGAAEPADVTPVVVCPPKFVCTDDKCSLNPQIGEALPIDFIDVLNKGRGLRRTVSRYGHGWRRASASGIAAAGSSHSAAQGIRPRDRTWRLNTLAQCGRLRFDASDVGYGANGCEASGRGDTLGGGRRRRALAAYALVHLQRVDGRRRRCRRPTGATARSLPLAHIAIAMHATIKDRVCDAYTLLDVGRRGKT